VTILGLFERIGEVEFKAVERPRLPLPKVLSKYQSLAEEKNRDVYAIIPMPDQIKFFHALDIWLFEQTKYGVIGASGCGAVYPGRYVVDPKNNVQYNIWQPDVRLLSGILSFTDLRTKTTQTLAILNSYGRWKGPGGDGWDPRHILVGGILTFPSTSNIGALLAAYSDPPRIPFTEAWQIPTFPTDSPETKFPMSSVFSFSRVLPIPKALAILTARIDVAEPSAKTFRLSLWDSTRTPIDSKTFTLEGSSSYDVRIPIRRCPATGYVEITGVDVAEPGFTISDVRLI
jgi:hypothetical protein